MPASMMVTFLQQEETPRKHSLAGRISNWTVAVSQNGTTAYAIMSSVPGDLVFNSTDVNITAYNVRIFELVLKLQMHFSGLLYGVGDELADVDCRARLGRHLRRLHAYDNALDSVCAV